MSLSSADVLGSFLQAMQELGLQPHGDKSLVADGKIHRYRVDGDSSGSENGWYVIYVDGLLPAGAFGSWKTDISTNWCSKTELALSPSEREDRRRKLEAAKQAREVEQGVVQQQARDKAAHLDGIAQLAAAGGHPYLIAKGVKPYGLKILKDSLLVPVRNASGVVTSLQFIQADGSKKFLTGGVVSGGYFAIGKPNGIVLICEGYATGASLHEATGYAVAVAFNAGNLAAVAKAMREKFAGYTLIVCADNDRFQECNIGLRDARRCVTQSDCLISTPEFSDDELIGGKHPTDFNDLHQLHGLEAVRTVIEGVINAPAVAAAPAEKAVKKTLKEFEVLIDDTDDFEVLTDGLLVMLAGGELKRPAVEYLISKIAKKASVPKSALMDVFKGLSGGQADPKNEGNAMVEELNLKHAVVPLGGQVLILNRGFDPSMNRKEVTFSSRSSFEMRYCNRKVFDRGDEVGLGEYWLDHPDRAEFDGVVFCPAGDQPGYFNLWYGWGIEPRPGCCEKFLAFIREVICAENDELFEYVIRWCAHLVQRPQELAEKALLLRGREGIGKNTFIDYLAKIVGIEHYMPVTSMAQVTGRFSGHLANALLVFCNESVWGGDKASQGTLKSMITDPTQSIEYKGRDVVTVNNYRRHIFASNEDWPVARGEEDRRYVVADVSAAHRNDFAYFKVIHAEMASGGTAAFMQHLLNVDVNGWHPRNVPGQLQEQGWEIKIQSGGSVVQWWFEVLQRGWVKKLEAQYADDDVFVWPDKILVEDLQKTYTDRCVVYKVTHPDFSIIVGKSLKRWGVSRVRLRDAGGNGGNLRYFYLLPSLQECRDIFSNSFSMPKNAWEGDIFPQIGCDVPSVPSQF